MKLTILERRILRFIDRRYPIARNESDSKKMVAIGERPLPTAEEVTQQFNRCRRNEITKAITTLIGYQCVEVVYLYDRSDFREIGLLAGQTVRLPVAKPENGMHALQVTEIGKTTIHEFLDSKAWRLLSNGVAKAAEEYLPLIVSFLLGVLLASVFGIDVKKMLGR